MEKTSLIGLDWGTSALRAYLFARDGRVIERARSDAGIQALRDAGFRAAFEAVCAPWLAARPDLPVIASGMIGSRQGWHEAPYVATPAGFAQLASGLLRIDRDAGRPFAIVPGVSTAPASGPADVMRGEETQVFGALSGDAASGRRRARVVLPGTHSKWVEVLDGQIVAFRTYLTGELYAVLSEHSIVGRLFPSRDDPAHGRWATHAFSQGLERASADPAGLASLLFSVRAEGLLGRYPADALPSYLSGLLIGAEIAHARSDPMHAGPTSAPLTIVAAPELAQRYAFAFRRLGVDAAPAGGEPAAAGLFAIATAAGLPLAAA